MGASRATELRYEKRVLGVAKELYLDAPRGSLEGSAQLAQLTKDEQKEVIALRVRCAELALGTAVESHCENEAVTECWKWRDEKVVLWSGWDDTVLPDGELPNVWI